MSNTSSLNKLAIEQMKRDAKRIAKSQNISHAKALDQQAKPLGYANWSMLMQNIKKNGTSAIALPQAPMPLVATTPALSPSPPAAPVLAPPSVKPKKSKNPVFLTVTAIGKKYALTIPAVRKTLIEHGYIGSDGKPTAAAISNNAVDVKMVVDQYTSPGSTVPYYRWAEGVVASIFKPVSELDEFCHIKNRFQAERKMSKAFERAGKILGVDPEKGSQKTPKQLNLTTAQYDAFVEGHFGGLDFLGGTTRFLTAQNKDDIASIQKYLTPLVTGISKKLQSVDPAEALFFEESTKRIMQWLAKQC